MAKKTSNTRPANKPAEPVKLTDKDKKTLDSLRKLASDVAKSATQKTAPEMSILSRSLSNVKFNQSQKILEMGSSKTSRELFNLSQAKAFMQTVLVGSGCKRLIEQGKTTSLRGLYYMLKHTIDGTSEETFEEQSESDTMIEDVEVLLSSLREELHLYAQKRGEMVGQITVVDSGDEIDCTRMGSGGYGIPSIVEPDRITFKNVKAKFILHVEKDTVWQRFNEDKFWLKHNCILTHGAGQPPRGVRRMLYRLHNELKLPVYCLLDNDPWGYYIYSVIKQGSINLAYESERMAIPGARYLGLRSLDYDRCGLSSSVKIKLNDQDIKRAKQIASYPWFIKKKAWQKEIEMMLKNGFKLEVESLISKDISYVTEEYVPELLESGEFLD
ncbi:DNA topoisomerase (ATP-hydrolyzing) [Pirellula staleyi DSM 6068]|uniref:Type 2 DNA topoisomerase 6 subunit A n=1 Tax=Pirellula staleyi (strain ATCC 27377 / DSM 6068 / ICPB 4128) TaxID=530564 RepID=D2R7E7_PIRSD|nr:DNA topoisomerase IV subunit A [Pirellula staleyi]ADB15643.1 DNA topoisomerase (ATP-hydrolyzing) [Pirellula staleyi DSM 6068]